MRTLPSQRSSDDNEDVAGRAVSQQAALREILPEVTLMNVSIVVHMVNMVVGRIMSTVVQVVMIRRIRTRIKMWFMEGL